MFSPSDPARRDGLRARWTRVTLRRVALLVMICAAVGGSVAAWAYWSAGASVGANGAGAAASVNQGATPTATAASGRTVTVSWGASTLSSGHAVDGYIVKRYDAGSGLPQTVLAGCAGTTVATTCTETDLPTGQWQYTVTPVIATNWQGPESLKSGAATIGPATLTLARTLFGAPLPQATTGSVAGFAANEGVSYRLDAATPLAGSPSSVNVSGNAAITSLTIPNASDGAHTVYTLGSASPNASQASTGIVIDTIPPTASAVLTPVPNGAGWNNTAPVQVTLSANDGSGSGVAQIKYTTDASDPTSSGTAQVYSAALSLSSTTTVKYFATDNAGNASAVQTQLVKVDTVAPTNVISLSGVSGGASVSGTTIYYRGSAAGSFTLTNALTDGGSGPASSGTAALAGTSTGWSHTSSLVSTPAGGPYVSNAFSWGAGTSSAPTESVTGTDVAANTSTTTLTFTSDTTAPSGGSVDASGLVGTNGRYSRSLTLNPTFTKGTDTGSGLAPTGSQLLRASAPLTSATGTADGTCGAYGAYTQVGANDPVSPVTDTVPTDNQCYRYEYLVPDNVGNLATYTSPDIKVETTAPGSLTPTNALITPVSGGASQFVSGATVYYNPAQSGSFTVDSSAIDARSGVAQVAFPALGGFAGGGNVTTPNAGTTFRTTVSWSNNGASASPGAQSVAATNNAGAAATNASAFSVVKDATAPAGGSVDATGLVGTGARYSTSLALSIAFAKGADGGSGVAASGAQLLRASATLTSDGTSNGACGAYGAYAQVGANDPASPKADNVPVDHTCYRYEYLVPDNVGNMATYTSADIKVDTTVAGPTTPTLAFSGLTNAYWSGAGSTVYYGASQASGAFTLTASSTDAFSGIASYAFPALGAGWTSTAGALGVNTYSWSAPNPTAPGANRPVTATNNVARTSAAGTFNAVADVTPPATGTVTYAGGYYRSLSVSVTFTPGTDAGGSGVNASSGLLQRASAPLTAGVCGAYGAFATVATNPTSPYADGAVTSGRCYKYQYLISDNVGNQATYTSANVAKLDYSNAVLGTAGLSHYWRLAENTISSDSFTGTAGTTLQAHTGEIGATWAYAGSANVNAVITDANRLRRNGTGLSAYIASGAPPSADYSVQADVVVKSLLAQDSAGVLGRVTAGDNSYFAGYVNFGTPEWAIVSDVGGSATLLSTTPVTLAVGQTYAVKLNMVGSTISMLVNGAQVLSVADTTFAAAGSAGVALGFAGASPAPTNTTGLHLDNFSVAPPAADTQGTNNGTYFNGVTLGVAGALAGDANTAAQFNGANSYVSVARQIQDDFAIEFWFKSTQGLNTSSQWWGNAGLVDGDSSGTANDFGVSLRSDGKITAGVGNPDTTIVSGAGGYNDGSWHHVVFNRTKATGAISLYVDNVLAGSATGNSNALSASPILAFGHTASGGNYFSGTLDEVATYSAPLSAVDIAGHYHLGLGS